MARPGGSGALLRLQRLLEQLPRCSSSSSTEVNSAKVEVNGIHLHYQQTGNGNHAVLLLPGMLGSGQTDFGPQLRSMNKQLFTVVAWDPRGYGKSIPPARDFPLDFFERDAKDAVDLMQTLKFKKFSLLGWSDGGITALIAAARYPNLIHKMVVWGANSSIKEEDVKLYNAIRDVSKWSEKVRKPMEEMYGYEYFSKTCEAWVDGISQFIHEPDGSICQSSLPHIKCPTLIIHGEKDPLVPRFHPEYLHKHIRGSKRLEILRAEREKILTHKAETVKKSQDLLVCHNCCAVKRCTNLFQETWIRKCKRPRQKAALMLSSFMAGMDPCSTHGRSEGAPLENFTNQLHN